MSILSKGKLRSMEDCIHAAHEVITCSIYSTCTCTVHTRERTKFGAGKSTRGLLTFLEVHVAGQKPHIKPVSWPKHF